MSRCLSLALAHGEGKRKVEVTERGAPTEDLVGDRDWRRLQLEEEEPSGFGGGRRGEDVSEYYPKLEEFLVCHQG